MSHYLKESVTNPQDCKLSGVEIMFYSSRILRSTKRELHKCLLNSKAYCFMSGYVACGDCSWYHD